MSKLRSLVPLAALAFAGASVAQPSTTPTTSDQAPGSDKVCQYVVGSEPGAKPYQLCLTKGEWAAKKLADARDPNRTVCHYEETPGTRLRSRKICMTSTEWAEQRRLEREAVDKLQSSVCIPGAGC